MMRAMLWSVAGVAMTVAGETGDAQKANAAEKADAPAGAKSTPYVHTVIFYVKKDAPDGEKEALITDAHTLLAKIPSVRTLRIGRPAEKSTPELAQKDYQVGLMILFDNYDGLKTYLEHPLHLKYVDLHQKHLDKVSVYDFEHQDK